MQVGVVRWSNVHHAYALVHSASFPCRSSSSYTPAWCITAVPGEMCPSHELCTPALQRCGSRLWRASLSAVLRQIGGTGGGGGGGVLKSYS